MEENREVLSGDVVVTEMEPENKEVHSLGDAVIGAGIALAGVGIVKGISWAVGKIKAKKACKEEAQPKKVKQQLAAGEDFDDSVEEESEE